MRSLGAFLWCALFLLQSVWADVNCNWQIPKITESCTQIITWKVHSVKQAQATCLEHFPTTYVEGKQYGSNDELVQCTVYRQFQCDFQANSLSIFDKCYYFKDPNDEVTLQDYLANPATHCPGGGKLPVFLTMTQAKHIAKRAHMKGIAKMWVNLDINGRLIETVNEDLVAGFMLHKNLWKVHKDTWWNGEKLEVSKPSSDGSVVDAKVTHLFFRTDNDLVRNLWRGQFEMATLQSKATIVCEYQAKIVPEQRRYCDKLGKDGLGLNAIYDNKQGRERCLYTSLSKYPLKGKKEAIEQFSACNERPSNEHVAGLDDGTADASAYAFLTKSGTYRVAAIKLDLTDKDRPGGEKWIGKMRGKCKGGFDEHHRQPFTIFDHFMKRRFGGYLSSNWSAGYPRNECSDFPEGEMDSNTLAIRNSLIIDVPVPVHFKAICSIESNLDCNLKAHNCRDDQKCTNVKEWNSGTGMYAKCECVKFHKDTGSACVWDKSTWGDDVCVRIEDQNLNGVGTYWKSFPSKSVMQDTSISGLSNDKKFRAVGAVVRYKCTLSIYSHDRDSCALLSKVGYGEYEVPNTKSGTFQGHKETMDPWYMDCTCP